MPTRPFLIAIAGNPNSGKTTLFNALTGRQERVGNYPGVTVEIKRSPLTRHGRTIQVVDLPGTYSLAATSPEELIARDFIITQRPDWIVNVVDATNLERNLYLTTQLLEMEVPVVLYLSMMDEAGKQGQRIDLDRLSQLLGIAVVAPPAPRSGPQHLWDAIEDQARSTPPRKPCRYQAELEYSLFSMAHDLLTLPQPLPLPARWVAIKWLEKDLRIRQQILDPGVALKLDQQMEKLEKDRGEPAETVLADHRYGFITGAFHETVVQTAGSRFTLSDRLDRLVLDRWLGFPIFLVIAYLMFFMTFSLGTPLMAGIEQAFLGMGKWVSGLWPAGSPSLLRSLLVDGVIAGVGGVLVFFPNILLLFLAIALLEDTGYMPRAAFLMDRVMHRIGLHGKSFIPFLLGFGCSVPAILSTRTLENRADRLTTMLVVPLVSCGARLPIYLLLVPAFFPAVWQAPMIMLIYLIGLGLAVLAARWLRRTVLRGETSAFVMELPPYRLPKGLGLVKHTWKNAVEYLHKAGTLILGMSVLLWALSAFPRPLSLANDPAAQIAQSFAGRIGRALEPVLKPLGFDWKVGTALIGALAAKEVFVSQMAIVNAVGERDQASLRGQLRKQYTPLQAFCLMLFMLVSAPCIATLAAIRRESGSWSWALVQTGGLTALAYGLTLLVYQLGHWLRIG